MFKLLKSLMRYKVGKSLWRNAARGLGFRRLSTIAGIVGGIHYARKHYATRNS